jgi:hypothetical protein
VTDVTDREVDVVQRLLERGGSDTEKSASDIREWIRQCSSQ